MAREAEKLTTVKVPAELPAGCEVIQAERTLSGEKEITTMVDGKEKKSKPSAVVSVIVPKEGNAEGLRNWIKLRSEMGKEAGMKDEKGNVVENQGVLDATNAIRDAAFNIVPKLTVETSKDSTTFILPITGPRTIDPFEAATAKIAAYSREHGRMPTPEEYAQIFAGLVK